MDRKEGSLGESSVLTQVYFWGSDKSGLLGPEKKTKAIYLKPQFFNFGVKIDSIACGDEHAAFISDGYLYTIGENIDGRLGISKNTKTTSSPCLVETLTRFYIVKVACGAKHTAAITESGELFTWGCGENGRLGLGNHQNQILPQYVRFHHNDLKGKNEGMETIFDVSCGAKHTGVVTSSGEVFTFGDNESGQLGTGSSEDERFPTKVPLSHHKAQHISCGTYHTLILTPYGHVYAFGLNTSGQLGTANKQNSTVPIKSLFPEEVKITKISASTHSAAISTKGEVYIWGELNSEPYLVPRRLSLPTDTEIITVNTGSGFTLVSDHKGRVWGLGRNNYGQLGHRDLDEASSLVQISGIGNAKIKTFSCGRDYVIALADFPQEMKGLHEPKKSMDTIKDSVKTSSNRQVTTNERLNTKTDYYDSSDEVIVHQDPRREESKVLESDLESLCGNHSHGLARNSQGRHSKSRMIMDLAEKYTSPGLITDKYILNLKEGLKNFETHMDSETDDAREESRTFSSRNQMHDIKPTAKKVTPRKYEQDLKEGKIKNILVDIKILRLQNVLLEQQLEERSHQIASLKRKLKTTNFSTQRNQEKEQKMKELVLTLEAQSLKYREECLKSSEDLAKKGMELDKIKRVIDEKNSYIESLLKDNHNLKELVHYFLQLKNIEQDSQHKDVHSVLEGRIQSLLDNIEISPTRDSLFNIQALMHNLDSQIHVDNTDSQTHHTETIQTQQKSRQLSIDQHHHHSASSSSPQSAARSTIINQRGLAVRLNENYTVPSPSRKHTPAKDSLGSNKTLPRDKNIPTKASSLQHADNSTAGDEIRISTRASQFERKTKPVKQHTKSQCSLNLGSLISPKQPSPGQVDPLMKFVTSVKAAAGSRPVSFHKKKFSEPALNFKPVAHVIEERNNKHMINNYFRTLQSEKHKEKPIATSKGPMKGQKPAQVINTQPGISTPAKNMPKKTVPLLQISPFNDFANHDKRRPESSQLYKKLLDMLNCPSKEGSANLKPSAKVNTHNLRQSHHQK